MKDIIAYAKTPANSGAYTTPFSGTVRQIVRWSTTSKSTGSRQIVQWVTSDEGTRGSLPFSEPQGAVAQRHARSVLKNADPEEIA